MHEMSLAVSLLDIVRQEMERHNAKRLKIIRLRCGALANVVPEAMRFAFEALTKDTEFENAVLEMTEEPLRLACGDCGKDFSPGAVLLAVFSPCPHCGEEIGHRVLAGKELLIEHIEVE